MNTNGQMVADSSHEDVLHWSERVVTAVALERRLNGHRKILLPVDAVVTPLAKDWLAQTGTQTLQQYPISSSQFGGWGYTWEREFPLVTSAVNSVNREGIPFQELPALRDGEGGRWAKEEAADVAAGQCCGAVVFAGDPGLFCCIANKMPGLRAVAITTVLQAARATLTVGANLLVVEMPGRTFHEIRQILKMVATGHPPQCPPTMANLLQEIDGHAHC